MSYVKESRINHDPGFPYLPAFSLKVLIARSADLVINFSKTFLGSIGPFFELQRGASFPLLPLFSSFFIVTKKEVAPHT